jgi:Mg-chelatase subunit ChlD
MMFVLFQPVWLLLLIPLAVAFFAWPLPNRGLRIIRAVAFVLVVLAMARLAIRFPDRAGTVVVVADRSDSMPENAAASQKETIGLLHKAMRPRDLLGVVSFGRQAVIERSPQQGEFGGFTGQVGTDHSSLDDALEAALTLIPPEAGGRILVLSDGKWTGQDPISAAARAAGRNVAIDYRLLSRSSVDDLAVQSFLTPKSALPGEAYVLSAWVQSPVEQEIQYQLRRGSTVIASGSKPVAAGLTRLMFRDRADEAGVCDYTVTIQGPKTDPVPENNQARALVGVEGTRPILLVSTAGDQSGLYKLLRGGGIDVVGRTPLQCNWSLEELSRYAGVLIENVTANQVGVAGMETVASWVEGTSSGLMMTGGQKSYGPGGYFKSPLDRVLPVSMEMRQEHRKLSLAIVVALDRSGSMAVPVSGGRVKMDLANMGTVQVLDLLGPNDEIGVIAVDSSPHTIVPLAKVEKNISQRNTILSIDSMGGGIFIYEALSAAAKMIVAAEAETKHIILFADAADSEEPGSYEALIQNCREANVSISVIGLGTENDVDANLLKDIARRGGGECYFTQNAEEIPRLFAQDTFTVARSTFIDQPTPFQFTAGYSLLGAAPTAPPALGGYNLCYLRPNANLGAVTGDEYTAPVVASWNAGNGRVLCFLGEADGKFSGPFARWEQTGDFFATLARWTAGKRSPLPDDMLVTHEVRDGVCFVQLHLDPERKAEPLSALPRLRVLHGMPGTAPAKQSIAMQWKTADLLEAAVQISGRETVLNTVEIPGQQPMTLPPVCLPYSPEFAPERTGRGSSTLAQIAATTGGKERIELAQIWSDLPVKRHYVDLAPWLLVCGVVLFLLEILERRTGWLFKLVAVRRAAPQEADEEETADKTVKRPPLFPGLLRGVTRKSGKQTSVPVVKAKVEEPVISKPAEGPVVSPPAAASEKSAIEALREARKRAGRRTGSDDK